MTKQEKDDHNLACLHAYMLETGVKPEDFDNLPFGPSNSEAKETAERVYNAFWPEHTSHQEWAESFNIKDDMRRVIMGGKKLRA